MISLSFQAYHCLSSCEAVSHGCAKKLLRFIYWKFLEAKVLYVYVSYCWEWSDIYSSLLFFHKIYLSIMFCFFLNRLQHTTTMDW